METKFLPLLRFFPGSLVVAIVLMTCTTTNAQPFCGPYETVGLSKTLAGGNCEELVYFVANVSFDPDDTHPIAFCSEVEMTFTLDFEFLEGNPLAQCSQDTFIIGLLLKNQLTIGNSDWEILGVEPATLNFVETSLDSWDEYGVTSAFVFQAEMQLPDLGLPPYNGRFCQEFTVRMLTHATGNAGPSPNVNAELAAVSIKHKPTGTFTTPLWNSNVIYSLEITDVVGSPADPPGSQTTTTSYGPFSAVPVVQVYNDLVLTTDIVWGPNSMFVLMEGARIIIPVTRFLEFDDGGQTFGPNSPDPSAFPPTVRGCTDMWESIVVRPGGELKMNGGRIQDGKEGVLVDIVSTVDIRGATFINNHIGIQKEYETTLDAAKISVRGTEFTISDDGLLPPMAGADNAQGIVVNYQKGKPGLELIGNTYNNLLLAVNAQNSNVTSMDGIYTNIRGAGIFMGADGFNWLIQSGGTFDHVWKAIECRNIEIFQSIDNDMDNLDYGYRLYNGKGRNFNVSNNFIDARKFGILMFNWRPGNDKNIALNHITVPNSINQTAIGIRLQGMLNGTDEFIKITGNNITSQNGRQGIHLLDAGYVLVQQNTISRNVFAQQWDGILTQGGEGNRPLCNSIASTGTGGLTTCITTSMSPSLHASCNTFSHTQTGMKFIGLYNPAVVEGNQFLLHNNGLQVGEPFAQGGLINPQEHRGNQWLGALDGSGLAYIGDPDDADESKFVIRTSLQGSNFDPSASPASFKDYDPNGTTFQCSTCQPPPPINLEPIKDSDCIVASGTIPAASHQAAQHWTARRHLYRRLLEDPSLLSSSDCTQGFFTTESTTTVGAFEAVRKDMKALFVPTGTGAQALGQHRQDLASSSTQLLELYGQLKTATGQDSMVLEGQKDSLFTAMDVVADAMDGLDQTLQSGWAADAQQILTDNAAILTNQVWEQNQKDYNRIWLEMVINGQETPDTLQANSLLSIAYQCPYAGGEAVYQSRVLLHEDLVFDDSLLCNGNPQGRAKKEDRTSFSFTVYPNPSRDYIFVAMETEAGQMGMMTVTDLLGRPVQAQKVLAGDRNVLLMLDHVPAGMYHLTVELAGQVQTQLFNIIK